MVYNDYDKSKRGGTMILKNATIWNDAFEPVCASIYVKEDRINRIVPGESDEKEGIDLRRHNIVPGFIDLHIHGSAGADTCDATIDAFQTMSSYLSSRGVTSFCATTMTTSSLDIEYTISEIHKAKNMRFKGARLCGAHFEGPFLSAEKCGAQNKEYILDPDINYFMRLLNSYPDTIKIVDIAPEAKGAIDFIEQAAINCKVSLSHSAADYETTKKAIDSGLSHASHLFNAMTPINHRAPGAVCAIMEDERVSAELICDLIHVHPALIRMTFNILGQDRVVIVSDAMRAAGMPDGEYIMGGQKVWVVDRRTNYANGRLAGSTCSMMDGFINALSIGVPFSSALRAATINPARVINMHNDIGSISVGKKADLLVLDQSNNLKMTIVDGRIVYKS